LPTVLPTARQNSPPPPNFDHDIVLEAVSNKKISPRPKLLAETTMKIDFITKTDVGGIRIL